jgi:hypothetical protein
MKIKKDVKGEGLDLIGSLLILLPVSRCLLGDRVIGSSGLIA